MRDGAQPDGSELLSYWVIISLVFRSSLTIHNSPRSMIMHCLIAGGSLTIQMFGSSSSSESIGTEDGNKEVGILVSDKQKLQSGLSTSPVIISSRKDVIDMLKK